MPDFPPTPELTELDRKVILTDMDDWSDTRAHAIALADWQKAEQFNSMNHQRRYKTSDELWHAWSPQKTWENTKIPRANMPVFLLLEQALAMLPRLLGALAGDDSSFDVEPWGMGTPAQARAVKSLLRYQLEDLSSEGMISYRNLLNRLLHQYLIYGNMVAELSWVRRTDQRLQWRRTQEPVHQLAPDPVTGQIVPMTTGQTRDVYKQDIHVSEVNKPIVQMRDLRDFYIDPNCPSPSVQEASYVCVRQWQTIEWIKRNCTPEAGFIQFSDAQLLELATRKPVSEADNTKQQNESFRGNSFSPYVDQSADPALKQIEIIRYYRSTRDIWMFSRQLAYNKPTDIGLSRFVSTAFIPVQGRWHGMSLSDLCEGDQRLMKALIDARLDELNLAIHPPIVSVRGDAVGNSQRRMRPGINWEVSDMKNMPQKMEFGQINPNAFQEVELSDRRTQKVTGNSDVAAFGTGTAGGNSANRTAAGIQVQQQATSGRSEYLVENIEDEFCVPILNGILALNQVYLSPQQAIQIIGQDAQQLQIDPIEVLNASVKFKMLGATRMRARSNTAQILPWILQTYMNPEFMQFAGQTGKILDITEVGEMIAELASHRFRDLWVDANPQQMQAIQQMNPNVIKSQTATQMQSQRLSAQKDNADARDETKLLVALLTKLITPDAAHAALGLPPPAKIEADHAPPPAK